MKIKITYFYNIRYFKDYQIGLSTAMWQPKYWFFGQNKYGSVMGAYEKLLSPFKVHFQAPCKANCEYKGKSTLCPFLSLYEAYLDTLPIDKLLSSFNDLINKVKAINNFKDEPEIILLVYEKPDNPCSERNSLIKYFKKFNIEVEEYIPNKNLS